MVRRHHAFAPRAAVSVLSPDLFGSVEGGFHSVVRITGMAFCWIGFTTGLACVVRKS